MHNTSIFVLLTLLGLAYSGWIIHVGCGQYDKYPTFEMSNGNCVKWPGEDTYTKIGTGHTTVDGEPIIIYYSCSDAQCTKCTQGDSYPLYTTETVSSCYDKNIGHYFYDDAVEPSLETYTSIKHYHQLTFTAPKKTTPIYIRYSPPDDINDSDDPKYACQIDSCVAKYQIKRTYGTRGDCRTNKTNPSKIIDISAGPYSGKCDWNSKLKCDVYEECTDF